MVSIITFRQCLGGERATTGEKWRGAEALVEEGSQGRAEGTRDQGRYGGMAGNQGKEGCKETAGREALMAEIGRAHV